MVDDLQAQVDGLKAQLDDVRDYVRSMYVSSSVHVIRAAVALENILMSVDDTPTSRMLSDACDQRDKLSKELAQRNAEAVALSERLTLAKQLVRGWEWSDAVDEGWPHYCPECGRHRSQGHDAECVIRAILSEDDNNGE